MQLDNASIRRVVAETFFEDFVVEWKSTGLIPKHSLAASQPLPLKDASVEDISAILKHLNILTLVEPFRRNGISGKSIKRFDSYTDIMDLDKTGVMKVVAQTFFEDYVQEWKASNAIPKTLLQQISPTNLSLKVGTYVSMHVLLVHFDVHQQSLSLYTVYGSYSLAIVCMYTIIGQRQFLLWQANVFSGEVITVPASLFSILHHFPLCNCSQGYIRGDDGIMLVSTVSLSHLLRKDFTSEDLLKTYWQREGNIYSVIPRDSFIEVKWADLPSTPYAVMSYQWQSKWGSIAEFILHSKKRVLQEFMWIDVLCLDQMSADKMTTIKRSDEIYFHAKEYHLMEIGSLFRGWVLFELSSVKETMLPPAIHLSTQDPAAIKAMKRFLRASGFDGCEFTEESDREIVKKKIINRYKSVAEFNLRIIAIVDKLFV
jgi:hypothetical protein